MKIRFEINRANARRIPLQLLDCDGYRLLRLAHASGALQNPMDVFFVPTHADGNDLASRGDRVAKVDSIGDRQRVFDKCVVIGERCVELLAALFGSAG